ncbi:MAG: AAA family ATPase [Burkholderiaceae bacterium]|nr:AAA family ATPase [Burkholderiaceae bacterium]
MYAQHFGLTQDPFSIAPDPHYLFMSERHREALAHLLYGVTGPDSTGGAGRASGGFVLLTGDIGTGKTTVCRCFLEQIPAGCHVAYIFNPKLTVTELLQSICDEFHVAVTPAHAGAPTVKDFIDALNAFLLQSHAAGESCVLIIDEAQNLAPDVLEQLRLLTNLETSERKLLQILLIGQPELRAMLARPELEQLAQRVIARFHLDALSATETTQYIAHRLAVAGHKGPLPLDARALARLHQLSRGVPRRINLLCGRALLGAWANGLHQVDRKVIDRAADEVFGPAIAPSGPRGNLSADPQQPATVRSDTRKAWLAGAAGVAVGALAAAAAVLFLKPAAAPTPMAARAAASASMPVAASTSGAASSMRPVASQLLAQATTLSPAQLAQLPADIDSAWRGLAPAWQLPVTTEPPCPLAAARQVQCLSTDSLSLPLIRQLGRPGFLTLTAPDGRAAYARLLALDAQQVTLDLAGQSVQLPVAALNGVWTGEFSTYWRTPPGYNGELHEGSSGPAVAWLAQNLSRLDGEPALSEQGRAPVLDKALVARVRAFQRTQGFRPDGVAGPLTLMQLNRDTGVAEPRLPTEYGARNAP